jgi:hypothetical protein
MTTDIPDYESYSDMFSGYLALEKAHIGTKDLPLVHHIRSLCKRLDVQGLDNAAMAGAYLQAVERLNKRIHPPASSGGGVPGDLPGQTSIFDELE